MLQIGCVFNHKELYANKQASDLVEGCDFNFANDRLWKAMDSFVLMSVRHVDGTMAILVNQPINQSVAVLVGKCSSSLFDVALF